jgi:hypothetical protein
MDAIVAQAIKKWPNVPACYGWLGLDDRGDWYLRDDFTQSKGAFAAIKGSKLEHRKLIEFIARNYEVDEEGQYFFQNGPQKVFVELRLTPYILRVAESGDIHTHSGFQIKPDQCLVDENGRVYFSFEKKIGVVHSLDMDLIADEILRGKYVPIEIKEGELEKAFKFVKSPKQKNTKKGQQS